MSDPVEKPKATQGHFTISLNGNTVVLEETEPEKQIWATATIDNGDIIFKNETGEEFARVTNGIISYEDSGHQYERAVSKWIEADPKEKGTLYDHSSLTLSFRI